MSKVWFFGDSFCANDNNWVKQVASNLNSEIANLGIGGASLNHTLTTIVKNSKKIQKDDYVIVCFTATKRHFFKDINFRSSQIFEADRNIWVSWDEDKKHYMPIPNDLIAAYSQFYKNLYTEDIEDLIYTITVNHIINDILPGLKTNKSIYFHSMNPIPIKYEFFNQGQVRVCKPLWHIIIDYLASKNRLDSIMDETWSDNHFLDDPNYAKVWWDEINPVLELIGAENE